MKGFHRIIWSIASFLIFLSGCATTLKTAYAPVSEPIYTERINIPVVIKKVVDKRNMDPFTYYQKGVDTAKFDRAVTDIIREALTTEFQRLGLRIVKNEEHALSENLVSVECEVLDFGAIVKERFLKSNVLELSVAIKFKWLDPTTGTVLEENERVEKRIRKLGWGEVPTLPFDSEIIEDYGNQLINDLLPRVIEKELRANNVLKVKAKKEKES
jgi:hypothetical protein